MTDSIRPIAPSYILPPEPEDSHVLPEDILCIGNKCVGYRHVSSEEQAVLDKVRGIRDGCSLNISFCKSESDPEIARYTHLDQRVARKEDCSLPIKQYEAALTFFIAGSIITDARGQLPETYRTVINTIAKTRFMLIATGWRCCADATSPAYRGLGRFPKENTSDKAVILLDRIEHDTLGISDDQLDAVITHEDEKNALIKYMASHYRRILLTYLRVTELNPTQFNTYN